ncbi:UDP-N-acetylglucosamine 1-carboxyvinyltransferase [Acinetobacter nosocomialis]|uniref:UDP-N-acetylglucosamine 1-carboxyvinyltransferase n=1 Tax=Acinetobacter nosocomialis TaxID=106654 RepID=UPI001F42523C|nr:hypothetical protein [Acinetobacter nosocomialis]MCE7531661.1 hypothetical protein [Acinetobacter nosocomialis]
MLRSFGPSKPIIGCFNVPGSKNSALPLITAAIMLNRNFTIYNVPEISDIYSLIEIYNTLGFNITLKNNIVTILKSNKNIDGNIPTSLSSKLRGSVYTLAAAIIYNNKVTIGRFGGDIIKSRSFEPHLRVLNGFGLKVDISEDGWVIEGNLKQGVEFNVNDKGITATCLAIVLASHLDKQVILHNISLEIECRDLINFMVELGVNIEQIGRTLYIQGPITNNKLNKLTIPPDQIVWGTYAIASVITNGEFTTIKDGLIERAKPIIDSFINFGIDVEITETNISVKGRPLYPTTVTTGMYPLFPSDLLPQMTLLALCSKGTSKLVEAHYGNRFDHIPELKKMGANIIIKDDTAYVTGNYQLKGTTVFGSGIRESTTLVLASLIANGPTNFKNISSIQRGYDNLILKLNSLGANFIYLNHNLSSAKND